MRSPHPAEGMYGSLRHLVKPILEKISVATRTWTASLKPTNSSLVPTSLKTWYPRSLLLTEEIRYGKSVQEDILLLLGDMDGRRIYHDRDEFRKLLESVFKGMIKFPSYFWEVMMDALSEEE